MLTLYRWRQLIFRILGGAILQGALFLLLALPFAPDLGDASLETRSFLGSLVVEHPTAFVAGVFPAVVSAFLVGLLMQGVSLGLGLALRVLLPLVFSFVALLRMAGLHPALASEWFVYQRSSTVKAIVQGLSSLEPGSFARGLLEWSTTLVLCLAVAASAWNLSGWLLRQYDRFQRVKRGFRMDELDRESRRYAMAGVSLGICVVCAIFSAVALWGQPRLSAPEAPSRVSKPHVFFLLVDGLRQQVLESGSQEASFAPFLSHLAKKAELATSLHIGSPDALSTWAEINTCRSGLRTGVRGLFPSRAVVRTPPLGLVDFAARQGYTTLLAADFVGAYLTQVPQAFARSSAPQLTLSMLASNSLLRRLAPLQAVVLHPNLRSLSPSLTLNPGAADARTLLSDAYALLEEASREGRPVFATIAFSEPYASVRADFPFLEHPMLREKGDLVAYSAGVHRVDVALASLWAELERAGWLRNAVVVVAGLRGYPFFGNESAVDTSDSTLVTPFLMWTSGSAAEAESLGLEGRLARAFDVAPTAARRMGLTEFPYDACDGAPLLEGIDKLPRFGLDAFAQESSTATVLTRIAKSAQTEESLLPFARWIEVDEGLGGRFFFRDGLEETVAQLKSRFWLTPKYRYVERAGPHGLRSELYDRERDALGKENLLLAEEERAESALVAQQLRSRLHFWLESNGVGWTPLNASPSESDPPLGIFSESLPP
jgi:hypothetical protein